MSVDINLAQPEEPQPENSDRRTGILALLLVVLLLVAAVSVALVSRGRTQQAALLKPTATATARSVLPGPTLTAAAGAVAPRGTLVTPLPGASPTLAAGATRPAGGATPSTMGAATALPGASPTLAAGATRPAGGATPSTMGAATALPGASPTLAAGATRPVGGATPSTMGAATALPGTTAVTRPAGSVTPATAGAATVLPGTTPAAPRATGVAGVGATPAVPAAVSPVHAVWLAEGASVTPFRTSYAIYNPGAQPAEVTLTLYPETGTPTQKVVIVPATTQLRVLANEMLPNSVFGAGISSNKPVYVERLTLGDRDGTSASAAATGLTWYFPEVQTDTDFTTWLTVVNPGTAVADLTVTYMPIGAARVTKKYTAQPGVRLTIAAQADVPVGVMGVVLESSQPVVAEHSIYFDDQKAAYGGGAVSALSKTWYIAGANTQDGYVSRLALFNPGKDPAKVNITYLGLKQPLTESFTIQPQDKDDVVLNDRAEGQTLGVVIELDKAVAAEMVTYVQGGGENSPVAAFAAPALPATARVWHLPETTTGPLYDAYLHILNPGDAAGIATVTYVLDGAEPITTTVPVAAKGVVTLKVSDDAKGRATVAASVRSTVPVVVDRVTLFKSSVGAAASAGIPER